MYRNEAAHKDKLCQSEDVTKTILVIYEMTLVFMRGFYLPLQFSVW